MKKIFLLIGFTAVIFIGCKKTETTEPAATPAAATGPAAPSISEETYTDVSIAAVPGNFTKKVLIEEYTGAWCGYCVDGAVRLAKVFEDNKFKVVPVSIHWDQKYAVNDKMSTHQYDSLAANVEAVPGFPSGMVNRRKGMDNYTATNRGYWASMTTTDLAKTASCGLAIKTTLTGNSLAIEVHAGFKSTVTGDYNVTIYVVENNVTGTGAGYDQHNYYSKDNTAQGGSKGTADDYYYYQAPTVKDFKHQQVLRQVLTASMGDAIPSANMIAGGEYVINKTADLSAYNKENVKIVAFINGSGTSSKEVLNATQVSAGKIKSWD